MIMILFHFHPLLISLFMNLIIVSQLVINALNVTLPFWYVIVHRNGHDTLSKMVF